jgi:raffinose/stachyose/melibiose transport system substrate-binding protein
MRNTRSHLIPRKVGTIVAAVVTAAVVLTGCSEPDDRTTTITLSMQQVDVETGDPTTWGIVQAFEEKYPNIQVTIKGQPVSEQNQAISVAAQSGTLPEMFWLNNADFGRKLVAADALLDLTPMLEAEGLTGSFRPESLAAFAQDGVQFGVPYQALVTGFYVNTKLLADNDLEMPVTFDDLLNAVVVLNANGVLPIANGAKQSAYSVWSFLIMLDRFGFDSKIDAILAGEQKYDNPDFLAFYDAVAELQQAGAFASNIATQTYDQAVAEYTNGNAAFLDSGVWAASTVQNSNVGADTVFWAGPQFSNGVGEQDTAMNVVGAPLAVSGQLKEGSAEYDAVQKFIGFYYSDEGQQIFADNGQPPVTTFSPDIPASDTVLQSALDAIQGKAGPRNQPDLYLSSAAQDAMYSSIYGVMQGQLTPAQAIEMVQKALDAE